MQTEVSKTKMVAASQPQTFKLKCLRPYKVGEQILQPGTVIEVSKDEAKELLSLGVKGQYDFSGEVNHVAALPMLRFFELVKNESEEDRLLKQLQS